MKVTDKMTRTFMENVGFPIGYVVVQYAMEKALRDVPEPVQGTFVLTAEESGAFHALRSDCDTSSCVASVKASELCAVVCALDRAVATLGPEQTSGDRMTDPERKFVDSWRKDPSRRSLTVLEILDRLAPKPEPKQRTLGQVLFETSNDSTWESQPTQSRNEMERRAAAVVAAHEASKQNRAT